MQEILKKLTLFQDLSPDEAARAMTEIMTGQAGEIRTASLLTALSMKGETGSEIEAFARSMRKAAVAWPGQEDSIICDTCGTGGDAARTINISTISAVLLASMGQKVAKHGNRAVSGITGSADLLESLGIPVEMETSQASRCLQKVGIAFLFAPRWHPAMKHAAPVRKALGIRTVFNLLGPLTNPAPVTHQMLGVFQEKFLEPLSLALCGLARKGAYVVHSEDGLDEVSPAAPTKYIKIEKGKITQRGVVNSEDFGFSPVDLQFLQVETKEQAVERAAGIFAGRGSIQENQMVVMNAALLYSMLTNTQNLKRAAGDCMDALRSGKCEKVINDWRGFENESGTVMTLG